MRAWWLLILHLVTLIRSGQVRFRLETFGLYYPSHPYRAPVWRVSPHAALLLLGRTRSYAHWLVDMRDLRAGPDAWWSRRRGRA